MKTFLLFLVAPSNKVCYNSGKVSDQKHENTAEDVYKRQQEYPACGPLIHRAAMVLDGAWFIKGSCYEEREEYAEEIISLYERAAECGDEKVATGARFMLASKYMVRTEYEKSQKMLDLLPERNHMDCLLYTSRCV